MFKEFFFLLLLGHIIGDFYFQTHRMSENKSKSIVNMSREKLLELMDNK